MHFGPGTARCVVLVSGSGTNLQALLDAAADPAYGAPVVAVGADRPGIAAPSTGRGRAGVPTFVLRVAEYADRAAWDVALTETSSRLRARPRGLRRLHAARRAGVPRTASAAASSTRHPALLPSFPGMHGAAGRPRATASRSPAAPLFVVDAGVDTGPIVAQAAVPVLDDDDEATLHERIKVAERALLVDVVGRMAREGWTVNGRKVTIP